MKIRRWEEWRRLPDYALEQSSIEGLYASDEFINTAIVDEVRAFWQRRQQRLGLKDDFRFAEFADYSTRYLIEECAVFCLMFQQERAVDIYPGSTLLPCVLFKDEEGLGRRAFTRIDFARRDRAPERPALAFCQVTTCLPFSLPWERNHLQ